MAIRTLVKRKRRSIIANFRNANSFKQRGIVLVMVGIAMFAVLAMTGLALDMSHTMLNKTRLQNTVDAAALAAAYVLNDTLSQSQATQAARDVFLANQGAAGNSEMSANTDAANAVVEYSATQNPFVSGSGPSKYVRVSYTNFVLPSWIIQVAGFNDKSLAASALSGPSPTLSNVCDLVPIVVCGDPSAGGSLGGFEQDKITVLVAAKSSKSSKSNKSGKSSKSCKSNKSNKSGKSDKSGKSESCSGGSAQAGEFTLADLDGTSKDTHRTNLAGDYMGCAQDTGTIDTQLQYNNRTRATARGLNTRFNSYQSNILKNNKDRYLPDVVTSQPSGTLEWDENTGDIELGNNVVVDSSELSFHYDDYLSRVSTENYNHTPGLGYPNGAFGRRNFTVAIADCSGINGQYDTLPVMGFGCFFLLQKVRKQPGKGWNSGRTELFGEFVDACDARGSFNSNSSNDPGPIKIQLYDDPARNVS